jgi:PAS domain S-box-containing protein
VRARVQALFQGEAGIAEAEFDIVTKSGERRTWAFSASSPGTLLDGRRFIVGMASDITERKRREANQELLGEVSKDLSQLSTEEEIIHNVGAKLAAHLKLSCYHYVDVDEERAEVTLRHFWHAQQVPYILGTYPIAGFMSPDALNSLRSKETCVISDVQNDLQGDTPATAGLKAGAAAQKIAAYVAVPYSQDGSWKAYFAVADSSPRRWTGLEVELIREVSERVFPRIENVRAERTLRQSEAQFRELANSMPQIVLQSDAQGRLVFFNERWLSYTGMTREESLREGVWPALHPDDVEADKAHWAKAVRSTEPYEAEYRLRGKDGNYRWHLERAVPMRGKDGNVLHWFHAATDIDDFKRTQEALQASQKALQEADKRKNEFLAVLAHELRNPLAPIRTSLEIIKRSKNRAVREEAQAVMERQTQQMVHLIDDLLDLARITRGNIKLQKERVTLSEIVELALEGSRSLVEDREHDLTVSLPGKPVYLEGDKTRLAQIVLNLLTNAAKYTPRGGKIFLTAEAQEHHVVVTVQDTGIGIPAEMLSSVFEMFTRVERETVYQQEGLGIGLSLVKQLVELHGGDISVESPGEGLGSTFTLRLPVLPQGNETREIVRESALGETRRVLVVDDYKPSLTSMAQLLQVLGHEVATAASGEAALAQLDSFKPDIILLDINMPGMDGYEVARRIGAQPQHQNITLVALTGYGQEEDIHRAREAGFRHHLVKPVEIETLETVLALA